MDIITGYTGKPHVTSEQDRDINIGFAGEGSYVLQTGLMMASEISSNNEIKIRDGVILHQGCAASIKKNTYDSVTIANGSQGMKRIDLIVARYQKNAETGIESIGWVVLQGTPDETDPVAPNYVTGDIQAGDAVADMPMYQVEIDGLNIVAVNKVFETMPNAAEMKRELAELNSKSFSAPFGQSTSVSVPNGDKNVTLKRNETLAYISFDINYKNAMSTLDGWMNGIGFTLPEEYRPLNQTFLPAFFRGVRNNSNSGHEPGTIVIATNGVITLYASSFTTITRVSAMGYYPIRQN